MDASAFAATVASASLALDVARRNLDWDALRAKN
jgi:hypothetical protein